MKSFFNVGILFFTLAIVFFCYMAFSFVRAVAWFILWHWMGIALCLVVVTVLYIWRSLRRD